MFKQTVFVLGVVEYPFELFVLYQYLFLGFTVW
jgi:hypothetical protein